MTTADIMEEYSLLQAKRRQKIERLREKNAEPPLSGLDERRRELLLMPMRAALFGEPFDPAENDRLLAETERQMEEAGGCPDPDAAVPYRCGRCQDTGRLPNGEMCGCMKKRIYTDVFGACDIDALTGSFEAFDLSLFDNKKKMEKIKSLFIGFASQRDRDVVILSGYSGVGKSFLLSSLAKRAEQTEEGSVMYIGAFALFSDFHAHRLGEMASVLPVYNAKLLIIDDLGTEQMTQNVTREYLFDLLETRRRNHLPTVFATNLDKNALVDRYTEKVTSRLMDVETSWFITLDSRDLRKQA